MNKLKFIKNSLFLIFGLLVISSCTTNQKQDEEPIKEEQNTEQLNHSLQNISQETVDTTDFLIGKKIYNKKCMVCHQENGKGVEGTFPPLAKSDYLLADKKRAVVQMIKGSKMPITVNGIEYPGNVMTVFELSDQEVTEVVNYILNSWGNNGGSVTVEEVKAIRAKLK